MGWLILVCLLLIGASALLTDLQLQQTASTWARIQTSLGRAEHDGAP